ncbi:ankyrin repeat domain-containing protein 26-like isoform X4 [Sminthopsis crassicaudata]|uniref:ankyrin repeat domain-containing protein 26-like isoform X4 n=1 Tax=Sminthopsis crassicaudata TaxID=9301 RepID=UPI003D69C517
MKLFHFGKKKQFPPGPSIKLPMFFGFQKSLYIPGYMIQSKDLRKIHKAALAGKVAKVQYRLLLGKNSVNDQDKKKRTCLHLACVTGHLDVVSLLVERKCKLDLLDQDRRTPLMKAIQCQQEECATILLEHGADPNIGDNNNNALHYVAYFQNIDIAAKLLRYKADIEAKNKEGLTPLFFAVRANKCDMADFLLKNGANVNALDIFQRHIYHKQIEQYILPPLQASNLEKASNTGFVLGTPSMDKKVISEENSSEASIQRLPEKPGADDCWPSVDDKISSEKEKQPKLNLSKILNATQQIRNIREEQTSINYTEVTPFLGNNESSDEEEKTDSFPKSSSQAQGCSHPVHTPPAYFSKSSLMKSTLLDLLNDDSTDSEEEVKKKDVLVNNFTGKRSAGETPNIPKDLQAHITSEKSAGRKGSVKRVDKGVLKKPCKSVEQNVEVKQRRVDKGVLKKPCKSAEQNVEVKQRKKDVKGELKLKGLSNGGQEDFSNSDQKQMEGEKKMEILERTDGDKLSERTTTGKINKQFSMESYQNGKDEENKIPGEERPKMSISSKENVTPVHHVLKGHAKRTFNENNKDKGEMSADTLDDITESLETDTVNSNLPPSIYTKDSDYIWEKKKVLPIYEPAVEFKNSKWTQVRRKVKLLEKMIIGLREELSERMETKYQLKNRKAECDRKLYRSRLEGEKQNREKLQTQMHYPSCASSAVLEEESQTSKLNLQRKRDKWLLLKDSLIDKIDILTIELSKLENEIYQVNNDHRMKTLLLEQTQRQLKEFKDKLKQLKNEKSIQQKNLNKLIFKEESLQERLAQMQKKIQLLQKPFEDSQNKGVFISKGVQVQFKDSPMTFCADTAKKDPVLEERNKESVDERCISLRDKLGKLENENSKNKDTIRKLREKMADSQKNQLTTSQEIQSQQRDLFLMQKQHKDTTRKLREKIADCEKNPLRISQEIQSHQRDLFLMQKQHKDTTRKLREKIADSQKNQLTSLEEIQSHQRFLFLKQKLQEKIDEDMHKFQKSREEDKQNFKEYLQYLKERKDSLQKLKMKSATFEDAIKQQMNKTGKLPKQFLEFLIKYEEELHQQLDAQNSINRHIESINRYLQEEIIETLKQNDDRLDLEHHLEIPMEQIQYGPKIKEKVKKETEEQVKKINPLLKIQQLKAKFCKRNTVHEELEAEQERFTTRPFLEPMNNEFVDTSVVLPRRRSIYFTENTESSESSTEDCFSKIQQAMENSVAKSDDDISELPSTSRWASPVVYSRRPNLNWDPVSRPTQHYSRNFKKY